MGESSSAHIKSDASDVAVDPPVDPGRDSGEGLEGGELEGKLCDDGHLQPRSPVSTLRAIAKAVRNTTAAIPFSHVTVFLRKPPIAVVVKVHCPALNEIFKLYGRTEFFRLEVWRPGKKN